LVSNRGPSRSLKAALLSTGGFQSSPFYLHPLLAPHALSINYCAELTLLKNCYGALQFLKTAIC
jgi:hypothetical protein